MKSKARIVIFAVVLGLVCSVALYAATQFTAPYRAANDKADQVKNFMFTLGVPFDPESDNATLVNLFNEKVKEKKLGELTLYEYIPDPSTGEPAAAAIQLAGPGLWGPIEGVIALEPDLKTIRGIRFYRQTETPGLGGEIGSERFQEKFIGKSLTSENDEPGFEIVKPGKETGANSVDGISGATMTMERVEAIIDRIAEQLKRDGSYNVR